MQQQEDEDQVSHELFVVQGNGIFLVALTKERAIQFGAQKIQSEWLSGSLPDSATELFIYGREKGGFFESEGLYLTREEAEEMSETMSSIDLEVFISGVSRPFVVRPISLVR